MMGVAKHFFSGFLLWHVLFRAQRRFFHKLLIIVVPRLKIEIDGLVRSLGRNSANP